MERAVEGRETQQFTHELTEMIVLLVTMQDMVG